MHPQLQAATQVEDVCMGTGEATEAKQRQRPEPAPASTQSTPIKSPLYKRLKQLSPQHLTPKTKLFESSEQASFELRDYCSKWRSRVLRLIWVSIKLLMFRYG